MDAADKDSYSKITENNMKPWLDIEEYSSGMVWTGSGPKWEMDKVDTLDLFFIRFDT